MLDCHEAKKEAFQVKTIVGVMLLGAVCCALAYGQAQKATDPAAAVKQLEHDWADAMKTGDADKLSHILADDWTGVGADGKAAMKKDSMADLKGGALKVTSFEFGNMEVKVLGNVAIVQGSDTEKSSYKGKDTSGKWIWMDVFVNRDGKWMAVRSQNAMVK